MLSAISPPYTMNEWGTGVLTHYWMDLASVLPAMLLGVAPGMSVLVSASHNLKWPLLITSDLGLHGQGLRHTHNSHCIQPRRILHQLGRQHKHPMCGTSADMSCSYSHSCSLPFALWQDMCAAPGGKTLLLAHALFAPHAPAPADPSSADSDAETSNPSPSNPLPLPTPTPSSYGTRLVANELDRGRRTRLQKVLQEYLPLALVGQGGGEDPSPVQVTGYAADVHWGRKEAGTYQRVLLDAPCTSGVCMFGAVCADSGQSKVRRAHCIQWRCLSGSCVEKA